MENTFDLDDFSYEEIIALSEGAQSSRDGGYPGNLGEYGSKKNEQEELVYYRNSSSNNISSRAVKCPRHQKVASP